MKIKHKIIYVFTKVKGMNNWIPLSIYTKVSENICDLFHVLLKIHKFGLKQFKYNIIW